MKRIKGSEARDEARMSCFDIKMAVGAQDLHGSREIDQLRGW